MNYEGIIGGFQEPEVSGVSILTIEDPPGFIQDIFCDTQTTAKALEAAFGSHIDQEWSYQGKVVRGTLDESGVLEWYEPRDD